MQYTRYRPNMTPRHEAREMKKIGNSRAMMVGTAMKYLYKVQVETDMILSPKSGIRGKPVDAIESYLREHLGGEGRGILDVQLYFHEDGRALFHRMVFFVGEVRQDNRRCNALERTLREGTSNADIESFRAKPKKEFRTDLIKETARLPDDIDALATDIEKAAREAKRGPNIPLAIPKRIEPSGETFPLNDEEGDIYCKDIDHLGAPITAPEFIDARSLFDDMLVKPSIQALAAAIVKLHGDGVISICETTEPGTNRDLLVLVQANDEDSD